MSTYSFSIESMIRGYHVYKDIWNDPDDEVLECKREPGETPVVLWEMIWY